jgi:hypothetical protein
MKSSLVPALPHTRFAITPDTTRAQFAAEVAACYGDLLLMCDPVPQIIDLKVGDSPRVICFLDTTHTMRACVELRDRAFIFVKNVHKTFDTPHIKHFFGDHHHDMAAVQCWVI